MNGLVSPPEQAAAITANTTKIDALISDVTTQFETLGNNDTAIGEQLTTLGQNDISIGEQMTTLGENDTLISQKIDNQANAILANTQKVRDNVKRGMKLKSATALGLIVTIYR